MEHSFSWELFKKIPIVGILRNYPHDKIEKLAHEYREAGLTTLEITMNTPEATDTIQMLSRSLGADLNIGAGTVCDLNDLHQALDAGARFIVTPILNEDVVNYCVTNKIPVFPGAYTPSEIHRAWSLGASMVKVFPASRLGPEFIKELLGPFQDLQLLPTGGINIDNFKEYMQAGAKGIGLGGGLFPRESVEKEEWKKVKDNFRNFVNKYMEFQNQA